MGPPRRNPSQTYSPSSDSSAPPQSPVAQRQQHSNQQTPGMSPAARYQHNLKVLRRRDPSILSIFDQFSHVCLYNHNGKKWEKHGYEGSMFLYERDSYPPYGFYILNRMGMDDHIQRLYPEDNIGAHGSYLIIRSYPEFTARRLASARASATTDMLQNKFSDVYALGNVEKLTGAEKGDSETIGLWMFTTDSREPLYDVFRRLHSYIKKNVSYPEEFRYGPDRPRPSNPSFRATIASPSHSDNDAANTSARTFSQLSPSKQDTCHSSRSNGQTGSISELDKLFSTIEPTPILSAAVASEVSTSTPKMTVESLFATFGDQDPTQSPDAHSSSILSRPSTSSTGISLLDDIFASAASSKSRTNTTQPGPEPITIYSPTPSTNGLPQILSQGVISTLMGLPPTRTPSAASTAYSCSAQSHPSSREGDNEDETESRTSDGGFSESSTVLDPEAEFDEELQSAGASAGRPLFAANNLKHISANGYLAAGNGRGANEPGRIQGDMTPRPPHTNGFVSPLTVTRQSSVTSLPPSLMSANSTSTVTAGPTRSKSEPQSKIKSRPLVPFESDSALWPYPPGGTNHASKAGTDTESSGGGNSDEVLELDFEDTSVLSDPDVFKKGGRTIRQTPNGGVAVVNGREKGKTKEGKKERAMKVRQQIENSWDVPEHMVRGGTQSSATIPPGVPAVVANLYRLNGRTPGHVTRSVGGESTEEEDHTVMPRNASRSSCASPRPTKVVRRATVVQAKATVNGNINGAGGNERRQDGVVDANAVRDSLLSAVAGHGGGGPGLERNDFVREVLTLIHTNKAFVDSLWEEYTSRVA